MTITDTTAPTFTASRTAVNTIVLTFDKPVNASASTTAWTVAGASAVSSTAVVAGTSMTLTTTGLTSTFGTPAVNYIQANGDVADTTVTHNLLANGGNVLASDHVPPTLTITMSNSALTVGQTSLVTFTFSETPTGFDNSDVTVQNGTLGTIDATNPLIQTATFIPTDQTSSATNVITVGTNWTDSSPALNPPVSSTTSSNYTVNTIVHSGGTSSGGGYLPGYGPRTVSTAPTSTGDCVAGSNFDVTTGKPCATTVTTATSSSSIFIFAKTLKLGDKNNDVLQLQKYLNTHGFVVAKSGVGSPGQETKYFGKATKQALGLFQLRNKIISKKTSKSYGIFGPATMNFVNKNQ